MGILLLKSINETAIELVFYLFIFDITSIFEIEPYCSFIKKRSFGHKSINSRNSTHVL